MLWIGRSILDSRYCSGCIQSIFLNISVGREIYLQKKYVKTITCRSLQYEEEYNLVQFYLRIFSEYRGSRPDKKS